MTSTARLADDLMNTERGLPSGQTLAEVGGDLLLRMRAGTPVIDALETGVELLDSTAGGLVRGEYLAIAAAPGVGKSTLADGLVVSSLQRHEHAHAVIFALETAPVVRVARMVCGQAVTIGGRNQIERCLPLQGLLRGELSADEKNYGGRWRRSCLLLSAADFGFTTTFFELTQ